MPYLLFSFNLLLTFLRNGTLGRHGQPQSADICLGERGGARYEPAFGVERAGDLVLFRAYTPTLQ